MKEISTTQLKGIQLEILIEIDKFCRQNNIRYSLAFGTLLGAIRHKGFIPWDDDIDIMMLREDYNRFISSFSNKNYKVRYSHIDRQYICPYAKVEDIRTIMEEPTNYPVEIGVNIDIFPIDNFPNNHEECTKLQRVKHLLNIIHDLKGIKIARNRSLGKNIILYLAQLLFKPISQRYITKKIENISQKNNHKNTSWKGCIVPTNNSLKWKLPSELFDNYCDILFEGHYFQSIADTDKYLTANYGDYMKLPPIEKQVTHHVFHAYWK